jgi:hypothetical protein
MAQNQAVGYRWVAGESLYSVLTFAGCWTTGVGTDILPDDSS